MSFQVKCSFGEIIDKYTILKIKLEKVKNDNQKNNILNEFNELEKNLDIKDNTINEYVSILFKINSRLWILEDLIRHLSKNKIFNEKYIKCSEDIHKSNDERYKVKREINEKFNSEIKEEKILDTIFFSDKKNIKIDNLNLLQKKLQEGIQLYNDNYEEQSYNLLVKYVNKYDYKKYVPNIDSSINLYISLLYISYYISYNIFKRCEIDIECYDYLYKHIHLTESNEFINYFTKIYIKINLQTKQYQKVKNLIKYDTPIYNKSLNISPDTISYPEFNNNNNNNNKIILVISTGGLGDVIMFSRYFDEFCSFYKNHNIIYLLHEDNLYWLFSQTFKNIKNLTVTIKSDFQNKFHYHINLYQIPFILGKEYNDINNNNYLSNIIGNVTNLNLTSIIDKNKKNIIINWCGSKNCIMEERNRKIELSLLVNLFKKYSNFNWISIQKNVNNNEKKILQENNILDLSNKIDCSKDAFYDTVTILKNVDLVISTDTSIVHLSGSMGVKTICLLTYIPEWRWTLDEKTNWYPDIKLLRQNKFLNWNNVLDLLDKELKFII